MVFTLPARLSKRRDRCRISKLPSCFFLFLLQIRRQLYQRPEAGCCRPFFPERRSGRFTPFSQKTFLHRTPRRIRCIFLSHPFHLLCAPHRSRAVRRAAFFCFRFLPSRSPLSAVPHEWDASLFPRIGLICHLRSLTLFFFFRAPPCCVRPAFALFHAFFRRFFSGFSAVFHASPFSLSFLPPVGVNFSNAKVKTSKYTAYPKW